MRLNIIKGEHEMIGTRVVTLEEAQKLMHYLPLDKYPNGDMFEHIWFRHPHNNWKVEKSSGIFIGDAVYAPLLCEMLDILPKTIKAIRDWRKESGKIVKRELFFQWVMTECDIEYINFPGYTKLEPFKGYFGFNSIGAHNINPATAAAQLYRWLHDNGHLEVGE
jgi:hypothetical protein